MRNGPLVLRLVFSPPMPLITKMGRPPYHGSVARFWCQLASRETGVGSHSVGVPHEAGAVKPRGPASREGKERFARCALDPLYVLDAARATDSWDEGPWLLTVEVKDIPLKQPCN